MPPTEACDRMEFWDRVPWPLPLDEGYELAQRELGWRLMNDGTYDYLVNEADAFSNPEVTMTGRHTGVAHIRQALSDAAERGSIDSVNVVGDQFALTVREAATRWGRPELSRAGEMITATFDLPGGGVVSFSGSDTTVYASFYTPQFVARNSARGR